MANAPDLPGMTAAFFTIANEMALLENLPAVNDQQIAEARHQEIMAQFTAINTQFTAVNKEFTTINKQFTTINKRFDGIDARLDGIDGRLDGIDGRLDGMDRRQTASDWNQKARSLNASVSSVSISLSQLRTPDNQNVEGFPATLHTLSRMNGTQIDLLLDVFEIPTAGSLDVKRRRFQGFIGVSTQV